jgi:protein gp37
VAVLNSGISWCSGTLNPWVGCQKVSAGCDNCYASSLVNRLQSNFGHRFEDVKLHLDRLSQIRKMKSHIAPDGTRSPYLAFVNSMSDFFLADVPDAAKHQALDAFEANPDTIFQILTKRPTLARKLLVARYGNSGVPANIWVGTSVESNDVAGRIGILRSIQDRTGKMTAFLSVEPIVGPTDKLDFAGMAWIITGGESGGGARIMQRDWLMPAIDQAKRQGIALWHKQSGQPRSHPNWKDVPAGLGVNAGFQWLIGNGYEKLPEEKGGATVDGKTYRELPPHFHRLKSDMNKQAELI